MGLSGVIIKDSPDGVVTNVALAQGAPGTTVLASAVLGRRHRIAGMFFTVTADATVKFTSGGVDLTGAMPMVAKGGMVEVDLGSLVVGQLNQDISIVTTGGAANGSVKIVTEAP
jgi:hypothetical protein